MNILKLFSLVTLVVGVNILSKAQNTYPWPSTGNVGIGTSTPSAKLEIVNSWDNALLRVGITGNRANTATQLVNSLAVVADNSSSVVTNGAVAWDFYNNGASPSWSGIVMEHFGTAMTGIQFGLPAGNQGTLVFQNVSNGVIASNSANIFISPFNNVAASFLANGNVLIGKTTQTNTAYKLDVNGNARANKLVVNTTGADYVFEKGYFLRPLPELEKFISTNHHLPEVATAKQMQEEGISVGDNQTVLLKKIEELTLYIIEQNKELKARQARIEKLERSKRGKKIIGQDR